jgi:hypothetical protein
MTGLCELVTAKCFLNFPLGACKKEKKRETEVDICFIDIPFFQTQKKVLINARDENSFVRQLSKQRTNFPTFFSRSLLNLAEG